MGSDGDSDVVFTREAAAFVMLISIFGLALAFPGLWFCDVSRCVRHGGHVPYCIVASFSAAQESRHGQ